MTSRGDIKRYAANHGGDLAARHGDGEGRLIPLEDFVGAYACAVCQQDGERQDPERPPASLRTTVMIHARFPPQRVPRGTKGVGRRSALGHAPLLRYADSA
jgi:hypothetical protein